mmetsp:Transcript_2204/g.2425  ORF Transcript_2204/g.2425 Transcript_2204/m.2425 type:complete len:197 (-) Transcript_2204:42-632(-)|eukprot:Skav228463  [mRNA]  locus=scaffold1058:378983:379573:- [translate_table: standard]
MYRTLLLLCCARAWCRVSTLAATGNPHAPAPSCADAGDCTCPAQNLDLSQANLPILPVQADSFLGMEEHEVQGLKVNLYKFKQPSRLSQLQLPFKLLLLQQVDQTDLQLIEVPSKQALDSWFPGFAWSILLCERCEGRHLGWKFTPVTAGRGLPFYALIVEAASEEDLENRLLVTLRAVGRPLAALGLAASLGMDG